jgi:hypothetical protein
MLRVRPSTQLLAAYMNKGDGVTGLCYSRMNINTNIAKNESIIQPYNDNFRITTGYNLVVNKANLAAFNAITFMFFECPLLPAVLQ